MKFNTASLLQLALIATAVNAQCVPGKREVISPGYEVEYRCGVYRPGYPHMHVASPQACALLAKDVPPYMSSYDPRTRMCLVASKDSTEKTRPGVYFTFKVDLSADIERLKSELNACMASGAAQCNRDDRQVVAVGGEDYRVYCSRTWQFYDAEETYDKIPTLSACGEKCSEESWCSFVHYQPKDGSCLLYSRPHDDETPSLSNSGDWYSLLKQEKSESSGSWSGRLNVQRLGF